MATPKRSAAKASSPKAKAAPRKAAKPSAERASTPVGGAPATAWAPAPAPAAYAPPMRPVQGLRRALSSLLAVTVGLGLVSLVLLYTVPGWGQPGLPFDASSWGTLAFGMLSLAVAIPTIILFCRWLHRVCSNARDRRGLHDVSPGWAVGSFFVPVAHFFVPYLEVRKAYRADVSPDTKPLLAWFVPWAVVTALAYVGAIAGGVISANYQLDVDRNDPAEVEAAEDKVAEASTRMAKWTAPLSFTLNAVSAWFLHRLARSWSDLQDPPAS